VSVDSIEAQPGSVFALAVRLANNNVTISALTVPLKFNHQLLTLDSVSFVGSIAPDDFTTLYHYDAVDGSVQISYIPEFTSPVPTLTTSGGVVGRLFFRLSASATPGVIAVDSINKDSLVGGMHLQKKVTVVDNSGLATGIYSPVFIPGGVKVLVSTDVDDDKAPLPTAFALGQNYPNPFNPTTTIEYEVPTAGAVKLEIFNLLGEVVATLTDEYREAGFYSVQWQGKDDAGRTLGSGVYVYRLKSGSFVTVKKMVLLK
jgi:hypothetical protein